MSSIAHLKSLVETKAGDLVRCDASNLRSQLGYDVAVMRVSGYDPSIIQEYELFNECLEPFITHPQFGEYLTTLTPKDGYCASGVTVLPLHSIRQEAQELAPGNRLLPHGCLVFATSVSGNAVCFDSRSGRVVWADHDSFGENDITYKDTTTGTYRTVPFTTEHFDQAVVPLSNDFATFLTELLHDRLEERLDALD
jgi:hypothetical protein